jgi:hypothetical protein
MVRIAAGDRMVLELSEVAGERHVLGGRDLLVAEEQHLVAQQQRPDPFHQFRIVRREREIHVGELRADRAGERLDVQGRPESGERYIFQCHGLSGGGHGASCLDLAPR